MYADNLEVGKQFQDFLSDLFNIRFYSSRKYQIEKGETSIIWGIEAKYNSLTGTIPENGEYPIGIWIEIAEKIHAEDKNFFVTDWIKNPSTHLVIAGNQNVFFMFSKKTLFEIIFSNSYRVKENKTKTSVGIYLGFADCEKHCSMKFVDGRVDNMIKDDVILNLVKTILGGTTDVQSK